MKTSQRDGDNENKYILVGDGQQTQTGGIRRGGGGKEDERKNNNYNLPALQQLLALVQHVNPLPRVLHGVGVEVVCAQR